MSDEDPRDEATLPPRAGEHEPIAAASNVRRGLVLFTVYLLLYAGFMGLTAFFPEASGWAPWEGVNLAILYGMGLILSAVVLASVYVFLCRDSQ